MEGGEGPAVKDVGKSQFNPLPQSQETASNDLGVFST